MKLPPQTKTIFEWLKRRRPRHWIGCGLGLLIIVYAVCQTHALLSGPELSILSPTPLAALDSPLLQVSGQARRIAKIYLNGTPIFTDEQGRFAEKLLLAPGYTIITLRAEDRFGRRVEKKLGVVL